MKWLNLFKGGVSAQGAFDTISSGIDKLAFTNEERAELNKELADKVAKFAEKTLSENTIRSKARRFISYVVVLTYIGLLVLSLFMQSDYLAWMLRDGAIKTAFIMVLAFFFGGYYLQQIDIKKK